jgi:hypothetical protein
LFSRLQYRRVKVREYVIVNNFPEFQKFVSEVIQNKESSTQKIIHDILNPFIINNDMIKPLHDVANEVGIPLRTLRRYAPDLCKCISRRWIEYEADLSAQKEKTICIKVFNGATELLKNGIYPSQLNLKPYIPHSAYFRNKKIQESIWKAIFEFERQKIDFLSLNF